MKSCFFIGHRDAPEGIMPALVQAVEQHIAQFDVCEFVVGHYGSFDRMAARAVICAKQKHPEVRLYLLLPYHPAERPVEPPAGFDGSFYPPGMENVPRRFAIDRANRYMIDHTDYLIAYAWKPGSNARNLVEQAMSRAKKGYLQVLILER